MRRSRVTWAIGVVAPWCLGIGLLVSFSADAGQNAFLGGSLMSLSSSAAPQPDDLVPRTLALTGDIGGFGLPDEHLLIPASLDVGQAEDFKQVSDEIEPRGDLKPRVGPFPIVDRTGKGEPGIGLRPSFDTRLRRPGGLALLQKSQMIGPHDDALPAASFSLQDEGAPLDGATSFAPWAEGEDPQDSADEAPVHGGTIAMQPSALKLRLLQGATPPVSRAEALSSTTPAQADGAPVEASLGVRRIEPVLNATIVPRFDGRPNYAALLAGDRGARERKCLAEAVYFEARSEPEEGQAAVAQVVLNRATSGLYPASICGVVYQNRTHYKACQFSFACEGKSLRVSEPEAWHTAVRIADAVVQGTTYVSDVGGATHYHARYVRPGWARRLVKMDVIGHHVFYKLRQGQT
jgi:spore germination cell wall hydrolase CwlJ-like protein